MQNVCPYTRKQCIEFLNRWIQKESIPFINPACSADDEKCHRFNSYHFSLFVKFYNIKGEKGLCYKYDRARQSLYSYSEKALQLILREIKKDPEHIIEKLRESINKNKSTPGAKEF